MKNFIFATIISVFSLSSFAKTMTLRRIEALENKVMQLEKQVQMLMQQKNSTPVTSQNGLRVKDGGNQIKQMEMGRDISSSEGGAPKLSDEKKNEIMKQLEQFKKNRQESQKILDEIMNEDY